MGFDPVDCLLAMQQAGKGGGGASVTVEPLSVAANGTYTAPSGKAYSPVTVAVPERDPYLYENCYTLNLSRTANTWTGGPTITIDCAKMSTMANLCHGGGGNPGYKKIKLKNVPNRGLTIASAFSGHKDTSAFEALEMDGNLIGASTCNAVFYLNKTIKTVTGGAIDLSAATNLSNFAANAYSLETISFVPSSIKMSITFSNASKLTDDSLVSIVNGLDGTVTGQSLTLHATPKARCGQIVGTVTDGIFAIDAGGSTTLLDFATTTKGWTVA